MNHFSHEHRMAEMCVFHGAEMSKDSLKTENTAQITPN